MHSDNELAQLLGAGITERQTIHQWPLSCLQKLLLDDGRKLAYKSQLPPNVEAAFYAKVSSGLLTAHRWLTKVRDCDIMTLDWVDAPLLRNLACTEAELIDHGRRVIAQIGDIQSEAPFYLDMSEAQKWLRTAGETTSKCRKLIEMGQFPSVTREALEEVSKWSESSDVVKAVTRHPRLIHGDLNASQVFVAADGYRVIDWQRPIIGPPEVDLVSLLIGEGIDPRPYVSPILVSVYWFLFFHWAVLAQFDLFPRFSGSFFDGWSSQAVTHILDPAAPISWTAILYP